MSARNVLILAAVALTAACSSSTETEEVLQWATSATASSQYGNPEWAPAQATGAPNSPTTTTNCEDVSTVWAPAPNNTIEWLELTYAEAVRPTAIKVHEYWATGQVSKIEVKLPNGTYQSVYTATPSNPGVCSRVLTANVSGVGENISVVRITIDQQARGDWNEIDAVQLIGRR